jgi:hypothetical protein
VLDLVWFRQLFALEQPAHRLLHLSPTSLDHNEKLGPRAVALQHDLVTIQRIGRAGFQQSAPAEAFGGLSHPKSVTEAAPGVAPA